MLFYKSLVQSEEKKRHGHVCKILSKPLIKVSPRNLLRSACEVLLEVKSTCDEFIKKHAHPAGLSRAPDKTSRGKQKAKGLVDLGGIEPPTFRMQNGRAQVYAPLRHRPG